MGIDVVILWALMAPPEEKKSNDPVAVVETQSEVETTDRCQSVVCGLPVEVDTTTLYDPSPFPTSNRTVFESRYDFGSASSYSSGNTYRMEIPKDGVLASRFTMKSGPHSGAIEYVPDGATPPPDDAALRMWISGDPDGGAVSDACTIGGYFEGKLEISVGATSGCVLSGGGSYWLNIAFCKTSRDDYRCASADAMTGSEAGALILRSLYRYG